MIAYSKKTLNSQLVTHSFEKEKKKKSSYWYYSLTAEVKLALKTQIGEF